MNAAKETKEENAPVRVQNADFSVDAELRALRDVSPRIGGIASFVGCARDFSEGRAVREISFDAYARMVVPEMEALRDEAIERFALIDAVSCIAWEPSRPATTSFSSPPLPNTEPPHSTPAAG